MRALRIFVAACLLCAVICASPAPAARCDFPDYGFFIQNDSEIPGNARGIVWAGQLKDVGGVEELPPMGCYDLDIAEGTAWVPVPFKLVSVRERYRDPLAVAGLVMVSPVEGFVKGSNYRAICRRRGERELLAVGGNSMVECQEVFFHVSVDTLALMTNPNEPPLKLVIGPAEFGELCVATGADSTICAESAYIDISWPEEPNLGRWGESLLYATTVTDQYYRDYHAWHPRSDVCRMQPPGRSWLGLGRDRLYRICDEEHAGRQDIRSNLDEGLYWVRMKAWLPGTPIGTTAFGQLRIGCNDSGQEVRRHLTLVCT